MKKAILLLSVSLALAQNYSLSFDGVDDYVELPHPDEGALGAFANQISLANQ